MTASILDAVMFDKMIVFDIGFGVRGEVGRSEIK
jgi:hypothetical protein